MLLYIDVLLIMEGVYVTESKLMIFPRLGSRGIPVVATGTSGWEDDDS